MISMTEIIAYITKYIVKKTKYVQVKKPIRSMTQKVYFKEGCYDTSFMIYT